MLIPEGQQENAYIYYATFNSHLPYPPSHYPIPPFQYSIHSLPEPSSGVLPPHLHLNTRSLSLGYSLLSICLVRDTHLHSTVESEPLWHSEGQQTGRGSLMDTGKIITTFTFFMCGYTSGFLFVLFSCFKMILWILGIAPFSRLGLMRDRLSISFWFFPALIKKE